MNSEICPDCGRVKAKTRRESLSLCAKKVFSGHPESFEHLADCQTITLARLRARVVELEARGSDPTWKKIDTLAERLLCASTPETQETLAGVAPSFEKREEHAKQERQRFLSLQLERDVALKRVADLESYAEEHAHAWPPADVLAKLVEAADILLHQKDYDGAHWELIQRAWERGKELLGKTPAPAAPKLCRYCGCSAEQRGAVGRCKQCGEPSK